MAQVYQCDNEKCGAIVPKVCKIALSVTYVPSFLGYNVSVEGVYDLCPNCYEQLTTIFQFPIEPKEEVSDVDTDE